MYEVGERTRVKRCAKAGSSPLPPRASVSQQGTEAVSAGHFDGEVLGHRSSWAAPIEVEGVAGGGLGPCTMAFLSDSGPSGGLQMPPPSKEAVKTSEVWACPSPLASRWALQGTC